MASDSYWDAIVSEWAETPAQRALRDYSDAVNTALLERWLPPRVGRVLKTDLFDEAVGTGLYPALRDRAASVVAFDVSPSVVAAATGRYAALEAGTADVRRLPVETASVDVVVSNSTLDHLETVADLASALRELARILRRGGVLVVTLDSAANPLVALRNALPARPLERLGLIPHAMGVAIGPRRLRALLGAAGFDVVATTAVMHVPRLLVRAAAGAVDDERLRAALRWAEGLGRAPTALLTGQFVAAKAVRR